MMAASEARSLFAAEIRAGLTQQPQRELPSKYLYDDLGSALFEAITQLPEYGLTRADARLLSNHAGHIARLAPRNCVVAELGSGSGKKTRSVLRGLARADGAQTLYLPIDVSAAALAACSAELAREAEVATIRASYLEGLEQASLRRGERPLLLLFLGSTIGNFDLSCALEFLCAVRERLRAGDTLLIGADLVKPVSRMLIAYDDPTGVTAAFNRNLLGRINRELNGDFVLENFDHEARWHEEGRRIEMHLRARTRQIVRVRDLGLEFTMVAGETIWTESSHKFFTEDLDRMAGNAGYERLGRWVDSDWPFAEDLWRVPA